MFPEIIESELGKMVPVEWNRVDMFTDWECEIRAAEGVQAGVRTWIPRESALLPIGAAVSAWLFNWLKPEEELIPSKAFIVESYAEKVPDAVVAQKNAKVHLTSGNIQALFRIVDVEFDADGLIKLLRLEVTVSLINGVTGGGK